MPARKFVTTDAALDHLRRVATVKRPSRRAVVYFIGGDDGPIKIGVTSDLGSRLKQLQSACPVGLRVHAINKQGSCWEGIYHRRFATQRLHGEWFERVPEIEAEIERLNPSRKDMRDDG